ncbi:hypothetical protein QOT17_019545 [Balamuthia mandrillaris]
MSTAEPSVHSTKNIIALEREAVQKELEWFVGSELPIVLSELCTLLEECMRLLKEGSNSKVDTARKKEDTGSGDAADSSGNSASSGVGSGPDKARNDKEPAKEDWFNTSFNSSSQKLFSEALYESMQQQKRQIQQDEKKEALDLLSFHYTSASGCCSVKGSFRLVGWTADKGDLQIEIRPTWGRNKQKVNVRAQISRLDPLRLHQVQSAFNFLRLARKEIARLEGLSQNLRRASNNATNNEAATSESPTTKNQLLQFSIVLRTALNWINQARQELLFRETVEFPDNIACPPSSFVPALPPEVAIEFGIVNKQICVSLYVLHFTSQKEKGKASQSSSLQQQQSKQNLKASTLSTAIPERDIEMTAVHKDQLRRDIIVGQSFGFRNQKVEVVDCLRTSFDAPSVGKAVDYTNALFVSCTDLVDKLGCFGL